MQRLRARCNTTFGLPFAASVDVAFACTSVGGATIVRTVFGNASVLARSRDKMAEVGTGALGFFATVTCCTGGWAFAFVATFAFPLCLSRPFFLRAHLSLCGAPVGVSLRYPEGFRNCRPRVPFPPPVPGPLYPGPSFPFPLLCPFESFFKGLVDYSRSNHRALL